MYWKYFVMHPVTRAASTLDFETRRGRWLWYQGYHFIYGAERRHAWLQHQHVWMSAELGHWCLLIYDCWYKQQGEFWAAQATHSNSVQCCKSSTRTSWCKPAEADQGPRNSHSQTDWRQTRKVKDPQSSSNRSECWERHLQGRNCI